MFSVGVRIVVLSTSAAISGGPRATNVAVRQPAILSEPTGASRSAPFAPKDAERAIQHMVSPDLGGRPLKIVEVAGPVRGWIAVSVSPPYREFPTIVLFRFAQGGTWTRVFEALTPGVQPKGSGLLDLHTKGQAFDYTIGEESRVTLDSIAKAVSVSRRKQLATVAHAYFFHSHPAGPENYFVDRTATYDLARRFFPGEYEKYPRDECAMFDVPGLRRIDLSLNGERLVLTAVTDNGQTWVVGWNGVDDRGFLTGKTVEAK